MQPVKLIYLYSNDTMLIMKTQYQKLPLKFFNHYREVFC